MELRQASEILQVSRVVKRLQQEVEATGLVFVQDLATGHNEMDLGFGMKVVKRVGKEGRKLTLSEQAVHLSY